MLHDLANDGGFVALKRAAEDRGEDTEKGCKKPTVLLRCVCDDDENSQEI